MRKLVFILMVSLSAGLFAQTKSGGTSGILIGAGNPYKMMDLNYNSSTGVMEINTGDERMTEVEIYDENNNLVGTANVSSSNFNANISGLSQGAYTVYALTEDDQVQMGVVYKP